MLKSLHYMSENYSPTISGKFSNCVEQDGTWHVFG